jgi:hypothetical protein
VDPTTALKVGLKVDADVLPAGILEKADLKSPATTVALLKMNAVVGCASVCRQALRLREARSSTGIVDALQREVARMRDHLRQGTPSVSVVSKRASVRDVSGAPLARLRRAG